MTRIFCRWRATGFALVAFLTAGPAWTGASPAYDVASASPLPPAVFQGAGNGSGNVRHAANRPWPFNGRLTNGWDRPVQAWSDTRGSFVVRAGETTSFGEDVDYVNVDGQWYKIGIHHTRIDATGQVRSYACRADRSGGPCI